MQIMCILQSKSIDRDPLWPQTRGRNDKLKPFHPQCLWMLMKHKIQIRPKKSLLFHHFFGGFIPAGPEARSLARWYKRLGDRGAGTCGHLATCVICMQHVTAISSRTLLTCGTFPGPSFLRPRVRGRSPWMNHRYHGGTQNHAIVLVCRKCM